MGVFKNDVGRPTNKSIMIRNIFKVIVLLIIVGGALALGYYLKGNEGKKEDIKTTKKDENEEIADNIVVNGVIQIYERDGYYTSIPSGDTSEYKIVNTYYCKSKNCKIIRDADYDSGIYSSITSVLIYDGKYVIYNFKDNKTTNINLKGIKKSSYKKIKLMVANKKIIGYRITGNNGKTALYNLELNKLVTDYKYEKRLNYEENYINYKKGYIGDSYKTGDNFSSVLIDFNTGKEVIVDSGNYGSDGFVELKTIGNNEYIVFAYGPDPGLYNIYNLDFKNIVKETSYYGYDKNGNIAYESNNKFYVVDKNGINKYVSKTFKEESVVPVNDYVIVIDSDNYLKLLDYNGKEVHRYVKITNDMQFHPMLSGWYKENGKNGIYIVVQDKNVKYTDLSDKLKKELSDGTDSSNDYGYEYYYIPSNGETGKIATYIGGYAKPVLYLYPTKDNTKVTVSFEKENLLTTTYPKYKKAWEVTANKNGDLHDKDGKYYYGLYWEESGSTKVDFKEGFYVTKENAIKFLEDKLSVIGLNEKEENEFIMYWLPILEKNGKNLVYFELTESREKYNKLNINPKPDSLLRIAIHVKKVNKKTNIKKQNLETFERKGFTAVEWGGVIH